MMNQKFAVICLWALIILVPTLSFSQDNETLQGRIIDSKSNEPVPFATIKLRTKNGTFGVIGNVDGDFSIPARIHSTIDTVSVSSIGYVTRIVDVNEFKPGVVNNIMLTPAVTRLDEVVISARDAKRKKELSPDRIIREAISHIPKNFPQKPYSYLGYYRDYQIRDSSYLNLNEAIVEVYDKGFPTNDQLDTDISLYEYKRNETFKRDTTTEVPYDNRPNTYDKGLNKYIPNAVLYGFGGNELSVLRVHDAIRNVNQQSYSFVNVFANDFINNHYLKREESVLLDTLFLYCISFETKFNISGPMYFAKGKIYIERNNYAIHKLEYACYNRSMHGVQTMFDVKVEYARHNKLMYLNYISFNNFFKTQNDVDFKVIDFKYDQFKNAFVVNFNSPPAPVELKDNRNFSIQQGNKPFKIKYVEQLAERQIAIYVEDAGRDMMRKMNEKSASELKYSMKLHDIQNRELDKYTVATVNQFRELFVEQVHATQKLPQNTTVIRRDLPLIHNPMLSKATGDYWMNPPLLKR